jgi:penicillin-binding protein 2
MTELKDTEREVHLFRLRLSVAGVLVFILFACLFSRFVWLQVYKHKDYVAQAEDNRISVVPVVPNRGLILDRNGVVLARNYSAYTLEITPSKIDGDLEKLIDELATIVDIQPKDRKRFKKLQEESRNLGSSPIRVRLTAGSGGFACDRLHRPHQSKGCKGYRGKRRRHQLPRHRTHR